jgi:F-type H+-transporting ATPase subunit epsilon
MAETLSRLLKCVVVTPEQAVLDESVEFVAVPMYDGELGVLPGRAPLVGRLGCGELRTRHGQQTHHFFVDGGFVQVRDNVVTVLTTRAVPAAEIKPDVVAQALQPPAKPITTPQEQEARTKNQERARAQLRVARHRDQTG